MKNCQEKWFNRRNWILENQTRLKLTSDELVVVLMIDFLQEFHEEVTLEKLAQKTDLSVTTVDQVLASLSAKDYFCFISDGFKMIFSIDPIFEVKHNITETSDLFEIFEQEFQRTLSQKEVERINEWLLNYPYQQIIMALREAIIANKKSIGYIEKVLANGNLSDDE